MHSFYCPPHIIAGARSSLFAESSFLPGWGWVAGANGTGAHSNPGFKQQTKKKLNLGEPPEKKSISDLP